RQLLTTLIDDHAKRHAMRIELVAIGGVEAAKRVRAGEAFDFVVLASEAIDGLASDGYVVAATRRDIALSGIAVAVAAGAARPDLSSEAGVRDSVLAARTIGY